jgi:hypothetical protein
VTPDRFERIISGAFIAFMVTAIVALLVWWV